MTQLNILLRNARPGLWGWSVVLALALLVPAWPLISQDSSPSQTPQENDPVSASGVAAGTESDVRVRVDVVNVPVAALNSEGLPIYGLKQGDFEIYEDGKKAGDHVLSAGDGYPAPRGPAFGHEQQRPSIP